MNCGVVELKDPCDNDPNECKIKQLCEKAKELGLDKHPNAGLIAQDVEHMFPEAVIKDENGYLMVDLPVLMDMDDLIAKLVLEGGVARLVQSSGSGGS